MELFLDMKNGSPPILAQEKRVNIKICVFNKDLTRIGVLSSCDPELGPECGRFAFADRDENEQWAQWREKGREVPGCLETRSV